jgi:hypothetical protein
MKWNGDMAEALAISRTESDWSGSRKMSLARHKFRKASDVSILIITVSRPANCQAVVNDKLGSTARSVV